MIEIAEGIKSEDRERIREILCSTGFFYDFEVQTAMEIFDETLEKGTEKSGYRWVKIIEDGNILAFSNYGKNAFSLHSWELYWIAVHNASRHKKLGTALLEAIENDIRKSGGKILWIETSGRHLYAATEAFYQHCGYELQASLKDYYGPDDPKQIYSKLL